MPALLIGIERSIPAIPNITNGINGYFLKCMKKDWPIGKTLRLIGVQVAKLY